MQCHMDNHRQEISCSLVWDHFLSNWLCLWPLAQYMVGLCRILVHLYMLLNEELRRTIMEDRNFVSGWWRGRIISVLPVVVLSSQSVDFQAVLGLDYLSLSELQIDMGQNLFWFMNNSRKAYCFEKDTNIFTDWTGKVLLSFYSAIDPWRAAYPTISSLDSELLHKAVERVQLDGGSKSQFCELLKRIFGDKAVSGGNADN